MRILNVELLVWTKISEYKSESYGPVILRCPVHGIYTGWPDERGWINTTDAAHLSEPVDPQPIFYLEE